MLHATHDAGFSTANGSLRTLIPGAGNESPLADMPTSRSIGPQAGADARLAAVKRGTSRLVDSIREHFASLPAAIFLPRN
jgi:hypothetical protein